MQPGQQNSSSEDTEVAVRAPDNTYAESLIAVHDEHYDILPEQDFDKVDTGPNQNPFHKKRCNPNTPKISYRELLPDINVAEWGNHTKEMLLFDWFPLLYFSMASMLAPNDYIGCKEYTKESVKNLIIWVYAPLFFIRIGGLLLLNTQKLVVIQMVLVYSYLMVSLSIWQQQTVGGLYGNQQQCFQPLHMSTLNLVLMCLYYGFVLIPFFIIVLFLPLNVLLAYKFAQGLKEKKLAKHYLIKNMPSVIMNKNLFLQEGQEKAECAICMDYLEEGKDYVSPLLCDERHYFHSDCIEEWLVKKNECPLCKVAQTPKSMREFGDKFHKKHEACISNHNGVDINNDV